MKKKKTNKKIASALAMLMLSAAMLGTSTYAWFTMSKEVQVSGLAMKTKVSGNLLISSDNVEANYSSSRLVQGRKALLEPVSTISGNTGSFFYTLDAAADGHKITAPTTDAQTGTVTNGYVAYSESTSQTDTTAGKTGYDLGFQTAYGNTSYTAVDFDTAYGYVDYVFYLKATADSDNQEVRLTKCDLDYTGGEANAQKGALSTTTGEVDAAWRIAVFSKEVTSDGGTGILGTVDPAATGEAAVTILKLNGAEEFTSGKAVKTSGALDTVAKADQSAVLGTIAKTGDTKYYKVTVRVWLEGEDTTCKSSTYAALQDGEWALDLDLWLTDATDTSAGKVAVNEITSNTWDATKTPVQNSVTTTPN